LAALRTGDALWARAEGEQVLLCDRDGFPVARLSKRGSADWTEKPAHIDAVKIVALLRRRREDGDPADRGRLRSENWEPPLVEVQSSGRCFLIGLHATVRVERSQGLSAMARLFTP